MKKWPYTPSEEAAANFENLCDIARLVFRCLMFAVAFWLLVPVAIYFFN